MFTASAKEDGLADRSGYLEVPPLSMVPAAVQIPGRTVTGLRNSNVALLIASAPDLHRFFNVLQIPEEDCHNIILHM